MPVTETYATVELYLLPRQSTTSHKINQCSFTKLFDTRDIYISLLGLSYKKIHSGKILALVWHKEYRDQISPIYKKIICIAQTGS